MTDLSRRGFIAALAASVVAAGVPLPVGWPTDWDSSKLMLVGTYDFAPGDGMVSYALYFRPRLGEPMKLLTSGVARKDEDIALKFFPQRGESDEES